MKRPLILGNWKLNGNSRMVNNLITDLCRELKNISNCIVSIAPPEIYLHLARNIIGNDCCISLGAQNVDVNLSGSFTGDTSAQMLKDIGVKYVIIGHSERRNHHKESDELIAKKFSVVKKQGLIPILCIGENEEENKNCKTEKICAHQIDAVLKTQGASSFEEAVIAYEPIWAIGTGKSATSEQAQRIHKFIRNYISKFNTKIAEKILIQYGGSVNISNAEELLSQEDIDGLLVGNASLEARSFIEIIKAAENIKPDNRIL